MKNRILSIILFFLAAHLISAQTGNVGINTTTPSASLNVKGKGNTSATQNFKLENSDNTNLITINDDGTVSGTAVANFRSNYYLGQEFGGGVIFYLWRDSSGAEHRLIASKNFQGTATTYSNIATTAIGTSAQSLWDGSSNTTAIIAQTGHTASAAKLCRDFTGGGFSDWYLPAMDELTLLLHNRFIINKTLSGITGSDLLIYNNRVASSTEISNNLFWTISSLGDWSSTSKNTTSYVRAIRRF